MKKFSHSLSLSLSLSLCLTMSVLHVKISTIVCHQPAWGIIGEMHIHKQWPCYNENANLCCAGPICQASPEHVYGKMPFVFSPSSFNEVQNRY